MLISSYIFIRFSKKQQLFSYNLMGISNQFQCRKLVLHFLEIFNTHYETQSMSNRWGRHDVTHQTIFWILYRKKYRKKRKNILEKRDLWQHLHLDDGTSTHNMLVWLFSEFQNWKKTYTLDSCCRGRNFGREIFEKKWKNIEKTGNFSKMKEKTHHKTTFQNQKYK